MNAARRGRPRAFDTEKSRLVENLYRQGHSPADIMRRMGIAHATFYRLKASWKINLVTVGVPDELGMSAERYNTFPNGEQPGFFDVQVMKQLSEKLGLRVRFKLLPFAKLFGAVAERRIDMSLGLICKSSERAAQFDFSESYMNTTQRPVCALVAAKKTLLSSALPAGFAGLRVGTLERTLCWDWAVATLPNTTIKTYSGHSACFFALRNRQIDASVLSAPFQEHFVAQYPEFEIKPPRIDYGRSPVGIMFAKGNERLNEQLSECIARPEINARLAELEQRFRF